MILNSGLVETDLISVYKSGWYKFCTYNIEFRSGSLNQRKPGCPGFYISVIPVDINQQFPIGCY